MLNLFRRHVARCSKSGSRSSACPSKPKCPIHYEGIDGQGKHYTPQRLTDPASGGGVRDWPRACEIIRDLETPAPVLKPETRTTIRAAVEHFEKTKQNLSVDVRRKTTKVLSCLKTFMEFKPRAYQFVTEIRYADLTDFMSTWKGAPSTRQRDRDILSSFFKYCSRADFTPKNTAERLPVVSETTEPKEPFEPEELEQIWAAVPDLPDEYGRKGQPIAAQTEAFALIMRYTGLAVSDTAKLEKSALRGNRILTYRKKTGGDVWTTVPDWVVEKLAAAPHDSERYFFWSGEGLLHTRASKWFSRLRKLLNLAKLPHRTPHNFRHHFAIELLQNDVPIDVVSRLMGHKSVKTTERSYGRWVRARQKRMEEHLDRVRAKDPLNVRMAVGAAMKSGHA